MVRTIPTIMLLLTMSSNSNASCTIDLANSFVHVTTDRYEHQRLNGYIGVNWLIDFDLVPTSTYAHLIHTSDGSTSWSIPGGSSYTYDTSSSNVLSSAHVSDLIVQLSHPFPYHSVIRYSNVDDNGVSSKSTFEILAGTWIGSQGATYPYNSLRGTPTKIVVYDSKWCDVASAYGSAFTLTQRTRGNLTFHGNATSGLIANAIPVGTTISKNAVISYPVSVSTSPTTLSFGRINANSTGSLDLNVVVRASSAARHTIAFSYASDNGNRESLTVDGNSLPYTVTRTISSGQPSRSEVFKIRITSSTATEVKGRLQITTRLT